MAHTLSNLTTSELLVVLAELHKQRDALLEAAEHGLSLMLTHKDGSDVLHLYHRCDGCEHALRILQAHGKYLNATLDTTEHEE